MVKGGTVVFEDNESPHLKCVVCCEMFSNPVELLPCRHLVCEDCSSRLQHCPSCQERVLDVAQPHYMIVKLCQEIRVKCVRCSWRGRKIEAPSHKCSQIDASSMLREDSRLLICLSSIRKRLLLLIFMMILVANTFVFVLKSPAADKTPQDPEQRDIDDRRFPLTILGTDNVFGGLCDSKLSSNVRVVRDLSRDQIPWADLQSLVRASAAALAPSRHEQAGTLFLIDPEELVTVDGRKDNLSKNGLAEGVTAQYHNVIRYLRNAKCRVAAGLKLHHYDQAQTCAAARANVAFGRRFPFQVIPPYVSVPMIVTRDILQLIVELGRHPNTTVLRQCGFNITLDACIGLMLSGRDIYLYSWNEIDELSTEIEQTPRSFAAEEDFPYNPFARKPHETQQRHRASAVPARKEGDLSSSRMTAFPRSPPGVIYDWFSKINSRRDTLAVMYVPVRIGNDVAREVIRCYWASLAPRVRREFPVHFVLGARRRDDQHFPFLFTSGGRRILHQENRSFGDLVLFDNLDADMPHGSSGTMLKVMLAVVHATVFYNYHYFVRGADDAYHNIFRMYHDFRSSAAKGKDYRVYEGHKIFRWINSYAGFFNLLNERVAMPRNLAPVALPHYLTGGGYMLSADVATFLTLSSLIVPPLPWHAEDYNVGRVTVPFAEPVENFRFHDFFNATPNVRYAFARTVPLILDYCSPWDYIIHKNPWGSYRYIGKDHIMYCTAGDFAAAMNSNRKMDQHECNQRVYETNWTLPKRSSSLHAYYSPYIPPPKKPKDRVALAGRAKYQIGGTGLEACTRSHFMGFLVSATQSERHASREKSKLLRNVTLFDRVADGGVETSRHSAEDLPEVGG
jgi:hypothetical protein